RRFNDSGLYSSLNFVVHVWRQYSYQGHHSHHRSGPAWWQSIRVWFCHLLIHDHDHVLGITRNSLLTCILLHIHLALLTIWSNNVRSVPFLFGGVTHTRPNFGAMSSESAWPWRTMPIPSS